MRRHRRDDPLATALAGVVGDEGVLRGGLTGELYRHDASLIEGRAPSLVCLPRSTAQAARCIALAAGHGRAVVARGAGTGLTGGAVPTGDAVVVAMTRMDGVREIDVAARRAWVGPGVVNLDLSRALGEHRLHFAPDPSSQQSCTIGGNVANNSGGPHCLAYGVTTAHVLAVEVALGDGSVAVLGGPEPEAATFDLRGLVVGSEGTLGVVTSALVRLTPDPPAVATLLGGFPDVEAAAGAVGAVIGDGMLPAALEMLEGALIGAVDRFCGAGFPTDAGAVLLVELDGLPAEVAADAARVARHLRAHGATSVRVAVDDAERARWWKGRKSAFGAVAQLAPDYYLHDTVVPRQALTTVLAQVRAIADRHDLVVMNVFHAGDGNLHPLLVFDARQPGVLDRVHAAGAEIVVASLAAGGVLSGEHGIGLEKRPFMSWYFSEADLDLQRRAVEVFDPEGVCNPAKVLPAGRGCAEVGAASAEVGGTDPAAVRDPGVLPRPRRAGDDPVLAAFAAAVGTEGPVTVLGGGTHAVGVPADRAGASVRAPSGIVALEPEELIVRVRAGTLLAELDAELSAVGQRTTLPSAGPASTVGGALAVGLSGLDRLRFGPVRDAVLEATWVSAEGVLVRAGGPTVKNVTGFDLVRLHVGAHGALGFLAEVVLRALPLPVGHRWLAVDARPSVVLASLYRPSSVLWDGVRCRVHLEGHADDLDDQQRALSMLGSTEEVDGPFALAGHRWSVDPSELLAPTMDAEAARRRFGDGFIAEVGVGTVHAAMAQPPRPVPARVVALHDRLRQAFDPTGRLQPGLDPLLLRGGSR